ncbi:hypothetical protein L7F22_025568 [Adiantum nelumboides]|nr:hypothetical protein [Adiantum nelumboides]
MKIPKKSSLDIQDLFNMFQKDADWCLNRLDSVLGRLELPAIASDKVAQLNKVAQGSYEGWKPKVGVEEGQSMDLPL